jgi:hypothetical protein
MHKNVLKVQAGKNFASAGIRPKSMYRFGTTGYKGIVVEWTAWRSGTGLKSSVSGFWTGSKGVFQGDWQGQRIPYFRILSRLCWIPIWAL